MIHLDHFIKNFSSLFKLPDGEKPWTCPATLPNLLTEIIHQLSDEFIIENNIAIHRTAIIEEGAILKPPVLISKNCFVGAHAYFRGGVFLGEGSTIGPSCEIKSSLIFNNSSVAHFNFIGDSIIGNEVNFEAGALTANHYNERKDKMIKVNIDGKSKPTGVKKFGALVGDGCRIGANAVLSPGTILRPNSVVKRLELVEQNEESIPSI